MVVALLARVMAQLILVLCFAAGMTASCIIFVLYGPVPKRRKITIVSRLSPPDPFAHRPAAALVAFPTQHHALPDVQQVPPPPVKMAAPETSAKAEPMVAPLKLRRPREGSPPPTLPTRDAPSRPRSAPPASLTPQPRNAPRASLTPQPRNAPPTPLPRSRSARGTERKPRPSELELELTQDRTLENTLETPRYSLDDMETGAFATRTQDEW